MSQNFRSKGLLVVTVLAVVAVLIGLLTLNDNKPSYELTAEEMLAVMEDGDHSIGYKEAVKMIAEDDSYVLVDLRKVVEFNQSHVEGAINIPFADLLAKDQSALLSEEGKNFILYGESTSQASNAWMVLRQTGKNNVKFIPGEFDLLSGKVINETIEVPAYDFKKVFEEVSKKENISTVAVVKPVQKKKKVVIPTKRKEKPRLEGC